MISHIVLSKETKHARKIIWLKPPSQQNEILPFANEYMSSCLGQITVKEVALSPCTKLMPLRLLLASKRKSDIVCYLNDFIKTIYSYDTDQSCTVLKDQ
jgi:hypothetical protein